MLGWARFYLQTVASEFLTLLITVRGEKGDQDADAQGPYPEECSDFELQDRISSALAESTLRAHKTPTRSGDIQTVSCRKERAWRLWRKTCEECSFCGASWNFMLEVKRTAPLSGVPSPHSGTKPMCGRRGSKAGPGKRGESTFKISQFSLSVRPWFSW